MTICEVCLRTDAATPGRVNHDPAWHARMRQLAVTSVNSPNFPAVRAGVYENARKYDLGNLR